MEDIKVGSLVSYSNAMRKDKIGIFIGKVDNVYGSYVVMDDINRDDTIDKYPTVNVGDHIDKKYYKIKNWAYAVDIVSFNSSPKEELLIKKSIYDVISNSTLNPELLKDKKDIDEQLEALEKLENKQNLPEQNLLTKYDGTPVEIKASNETSEMLSGVLNNILTEIDKLNNSINEFMKLLSSSAIQPSYGSNLFQNQKLLESKKIVEKADKIFKAIKKNCEICYKSKQLK